MLDITTLHSNPPVQSDITVNFRGHLLEQVKRSRATFTHLLAGWLCKSPFHSILNKDNLLYSLSQGLLPVKASQTYWEELDLGQVLVRTASSRYNKLSAFQTIGCNQCVQS